MSKYLILWVSVFLISCASKSATQNGFRAASHLDINQAIAYESKTVLTLEDIGVKLLVHAVPVSGDCVEETHGICAYRYVFTSMTLDDSPQIQSYAWGPVGELIDWKKEKSNAKSQRIQATQLKIPSQLKQEQSEAKQEQSILRIEVFADGKIQVMQN